MAQENLFENSRNNPKSIHFRRVACKRSRGRGEEGNREMRGKMSVCDCVSVLACLELGFLK